MTIKPEFIIIHHIGGPDESPLADSSRFSLEQLNELHKKRFGIISGLGYYVAYNAYLEQDGRLTQTRSDSERDMDALGYNFNSLSICLQGNFDATYPTQKQLDNLCIWIIDMTREHNIKFEDVLFHRDVATKTCPGINFTKKMLWSNMFKHMKFTELLKFIILLLTGKIKLE